jgi:hypothetical protein
VSRVGKGVPFYHIGIGERDLFTHLRRHKSVALTVDYQYRDLCLLTASAAVIAFTSKCA